MNVVYYDDTPLDNTSAYIYRGTTNVGKRAGDAEPKNSNLTGDEWKHIVSILMR